MLDDKLTQSEKAELLAYVEAYMFEVPQRTLIVVMDSGGAGLAAGIAGDVKIDYNCRIATWTLTGDTAGSIVVDIWETDFANFPPTVADTITGSSLPTLTSADKATDYVLTGWKTHIHKGDHLRFNINSVSGLNRVTLTLELRGPM